MQTSQAQKGQRKGEVLRFIKFTLFSASAGIVQTLSFTLMNEFTGFPYWPSYLIALTLSVVYNFTVNRAFTFMSANNVPAAMFKVFMYYLVFTPISTLWGEALTNIGWNEYVVLIGTMLVNFISEFLFQRFYVFKDSLNTSSLGQKQYERQRQKAAS